MIIICNLTLDEIRALVVKVTEAKRCGQCGTTYTVYELATGEDYLASPCVRHTKYSSASCKRWSFNADHGDLPEALTELTRL